MYIALWHGCIQGLCSVVDCSNMGFFRMYHWLSFSFSGNIDSDRILIVPMSQIRTKYLNTKIYLFPVAKCC